MAKTTPITDHERAVLAGIFARSNMGQPRPTLENVQYALRDKGNDYVIFFCSEFMETEEHEEIFQQEGDSWRKYLTKRGQNTREFVQRTHPDIAALVWPQHECREIESGDKIICMDCGKPQ